ncbi:hypothetical protein OsI_03016 [Oryza sativa Indica Group]|uniref:Uncharacterized protein n=1 Tax=Oryza sativa subsp. indica TaxID=39946 RepID=B8ACC5_ORYSI|nr:hypothetical protein OsI_03016 [Oryza sativa Indica Group]
MGACCCCFPVYKPARENPMRSTRESLIQHKPRPTTPYHPPPPPFITYTDKVDFPFSLSGMNAVERFKTGFENFRNTIYEYFSDALRVRRKRPELFERLKTGQSPKNQLDEIAKNLTSMAAQISDLARKMSTLEPLVPLAAKLDKLPDRVTQDTGGDGLATKQLLERYHASPLAHTILAQWYFAHADQQKPTNHLRRAAWMAPRCLHIAFALALVLIEMGSFDEADMVCAHSLLVPDLTDPVHNFISPKEQVDAIITSKAPEYRLGRGAIWAF